MPRVEVAIVGAGIVGLAVARALSARKAGSVLVLEKEDAPAHHQTGHNSGVIHSGIYYKPGSLKARLCTEGAGLMYDYCEENGIPYRKCGKLIIAARPEEVPRLEELERRGHANGVPDLRRIKGEEIPDIEPNAVGYAALHLPSTGIVDYSQVAAHMHAELTKRGVRVRFGAEVIGLDRSGSCPALQLRNGERIETGHVIVCAGLWADRAARWADANRDLRIVPFRGQYLGLRSTSPIVRGLIYPVPDPDLPFLGVHITPLINGRTVIGPTALLVGARDAYRLTTVKFKDLLEIATWPGTWRMGRRYWRVGLNEMRTAASRRRMVAGAAVYVPSLGLHSLDGSTHSGVRAQSVARSGDLIDDFVLTSHDGVSLVSNAPSPAATSALALGKELVRRIGV